MIVLYSHSRSWLTDADRLLWVILHKMLRLSILALTGFVCAGVGPVLAQEESSRVSQLRVLSSNGVKAVLEQQLAEIERTIGRSIVVEFSTASSLARGIEAGEIFDVAILTPALIDTLEVQGKIAAESRTTFARTGAGVGARVGEVNTDVSTLDGFRRTLLNARSVTFTEGGQSRRIIDAAFERLEITAAMQAKTLIVGPGQGPTAVTAGEAELVLTLISEILPVPGLELLGPFPAAVQGYISFAAGINPEANDTEAARAFVRQLTGPLVIAALRARGMEPIGQ